MNGRPQRRLAKSDRQSGANRPNVWYAGSRSSNMAQATAQRTYQRYLALARAAASTGDMIEMENYYQHAEHYFRVMRTTRATGE